MKKTILLPPVFLMIIAMFSCELANVYRPTEVEAANILESVQDIFLPVVYTKAQIINNKSKSKQIKPISEESDNGLSIEGTIKDGDDAQGNFFITEITLTANNLEIKNSDVSKLNGSIDFISIISPEKPATNNYEGELTITFKGNELQLLLDINSEIDMEKNTMTASGTYQIRDREYDYSYAGDGPLED